MLSNDSRLLLGKKKLVFDWVLKKYEKMEI